ncbi:SDR family oxidoreductase [Oricola sp.]|uniref:SDR family oxidoreductase n=1 Tax=Oricola sp. TaxID=1979950 RepID=UPI003BACA7DD
MASKPVALITGGARRIGKAIAEDLAANGFAVVVHANRSAADATALAGQLRAAGHEAIAVTADLTDSVERSGLIGAASAAASAPVALLVNNASIFEDDGMGSLDPAIWDSHFDLHLKAPVFLAEAFAAQLPADRAGMIVNIIDQRVWRLMPSFMSYTLSKSALWTATQTMAQALAPRIRVNAIGPGPTLPNSRQSEADFRKQSGRVPLGRGPELAEFGATIRFLWNNASITGQMIALDGGQHLAWETPDVAGIAE